MSVESLASIIELPDGTALDHGFTYVAYIDQDGGQGYKFGTFGDTTYAALIGLLEMVRHDLLHMIDDA